MSNESDGIDDKDHENYCKAKYPLKMKTCFVPLKKLKLDEDQSGDVETFSVGKRKILGVSNGQEIERKKQRTDKNYDSKLVEIWSKFFSFSRKFRWTDPFSPYEATNEQVASFVHYLKLTESVDMAYLEDIVAAMDQYHTRREDHLFKTADKLNLMLKIYPPSFDASNTEKFKTPLSSCPGWQTINKGVWKELLVFCQKSDIDPFKVSLKEISTFIDALFKIGSRHRILIHCRNYESTVEFIINALRELLMDLSESSVNIQSSSGPISTLLRAARSCDEKLTTNKLAISFFPSHNYLRCLMEANKGHKDGFWNSKFIRDALTDVRKSRMSIETVATEIGVTPEMVYAAMQKSVKNTDLVPSIQEYLNGRKARTPEMFWAELWVTELLHKVKNREETSAKVAAQFGVSRREIEKRCGGVRSKEEVDEEKERELNKKAEAKGETDRNRMKTTEVDKQISTAEGDLENLCEYELKRLENLRARKAMMEELGIIEDKVEMRTVAKRQWKKRVVARREKSSRVERLKENNRLDFDMETPSSFDRLDDHQIQKMIKKERLTPEWFGNRFKKDDSPAPERFIVPKLELEASQLLEITNDYRGSRIFLNSVGTECKILDSTEYKPDSLDWRKFSTTEEFIVSSSPVTALDSLGDFITFGTEAGGVGVLLGGRSVTIRPHSDTVTDVVNSGARVMSSSMDGSVRTWDLVTQRSCLEYCWDPNMVDISETRQGVCGMLPWGEHGYLLDCNNRIINLDTRCSSAPITLLDVPIIFDAVNREIVDKYRKGKGTVKIFLEFQNTHTIDIEPRSGNQFLVSREDVVKIYDFRNIGMPMSELPGNFAAWNPDGSCLYVSSNDEFQKGYQVFDVTGGLNCVPRNQKYSHFENSIVLPTLGGNPWCSWQKDTLFQVSKGTTMKNKRKHDKQTKKTYLSALNSESGELTGLEVETEDDGNFVVHCHKNQPQVVLANTQGGGRLKLISIDIGSWTS